jgi:hypothetical protein
MRGMVAYGALAVALIFFGAAGIFSIGAPFLLTGLVMLICFPWRRRGVVLPSIAAVWGFTLGYVLVAPVGCSRTGGEPALVRPAAVALARGATRCDGVFFHYVGGAAYRPPLLPAVVVGAALAAVVAFAVRSLTSARTASPATSVSGDPIGGKRP